MTQVEARLIAQVLIFFGNIPTDVLKREEGGLSLHLLTTTVIVSHQHTVRVDVTTPLVETTSLRHTMPCYES